MVTQSSFLSQEMRQKAIGVRTGPAVVEVEKGAIKRFAEAVGDPNPMWNDEAAAQKGRYGGMVAPPTFLRSITLERPSLPFDVPFDRLLDGGSEWEYFEPVRPGDRVSAVAEIVDVSEKSGRFGTMLFTVIVTTYTNQLDVVVATQRSTMIRY